MNVKYKMTGMAETLKTVLIASVLLIAVCLGWFFFFYHPKTSRLDIVKEETQDLVFKLQSLRVTEAQVFALGKQVEVIKNDIKLLHDKVIFKDDLPAAIKEIKASGHKFGLKFLNIIPDYASLINSKENEQEPNAGLLKLIVHFKLQGYYKSFGKFLSSLDKLPFYISLGEVRIVYNDSIHPQVDVLFDGVLFLHDRFNSEI